MISFSNYKILCKFVILETKIFKTLLTQKIWNYIYIKKNYKQIKFPKLYCYKIYFSSFQMAPKVEKWLVEKKPAKENKLTLAKKAPLIEKRPKARKKLSKIWSWVSHLSFVVGFGFCWQIQWWKLCGIENLCGIGDAWDSTETMPRKRGMT